MTCEYRVCLAVLSPGESFEHWCNLRAGHPGDHACADCGDVWHRGPWDDDPEPHEAYAGTCPVCKG